MLDIGRDLLEVFPADRLNLGRLGVLPRFSATVPPGFCPFPFIMLVTVTALLLAWHAPIPEYIAFSSVIILLAFAVCFMACSSFAKHGCLQANCGCTVDVSNKGFTCAV